MRQVPVLVLILSVFLPMPAADAAPKGMSAELEHILSAKARGDSYPGWLWRTVDSRFRERRLRDRAALEPPVLHKDGGSSALDAVVITAQIFRDSGNTQGKGNNALLPACGSSGADTAEDAWYQVTLGGRGSITAWTTCADQGPPSYDTRLGIFDENLVLVACNDDDPACGAPNFQSRISDFGASAGTYYIVVDGWDGASGPYELNVEWSENGPSCNGSDSSNPTMIPSLPYSHTNDSTDDCDDILVTCELGGSEGGPDHWYQVTVDTTVFMDVAVACDPSAIDTRIAILDVAQNELFCNDDDPGCASYQSVIEDAPLAAGTYYIVVDSADFLGGPYSVDVDTTHAPPGALNNLLPDLSTRANELYDHDIVTNLEPGRTHLRFSNSTPNTGAGKLYLYGVLPPNGDGTQDVRQRIWREDGSFYDQDAGVFVYHAEHGHIHVEGWAEYRLRYVTPGDGVGDIVIGGQKTSFCIIDLAVHDDTLPGFLPMGEFHDCDSSVQGLSIGWTDVYGKTLAGQNIDVTDIPDGVYWLESEVDPTNSIVEVDETNNTARIKVTIGTPQGINADPYEPNDSTADLDARQVGAPNSPALGPCGPTTSISSLNVHSTGNDDYFRFYMPAVGGPGDHARIDFSHVDGNLDLELLDANGLQVGLSTTEDNFEEISLEGLAAGWYDARIFGAGGAIQPDYSLTIDPSQNASPTINVVDPPLGDTQVGHGYETYTTTWTSSDPEGNETWVTVYVNTMPLLDGNEILLPTSENTPGDQGLFVINTAYLNEATYYVYLEITDGGTVAGDWSEGTITLFDPTTVPDLGDAHPSRLLPNVPNPFNPWTIVRLQLRRESRVDWRIYDVRGQLVKTLETGPLSAGLHERRWDGTDERGRPVASGVYFNAVRAPGFVDRQKLVLLK